MNIKLFIQAIIKYVFGVLIVGGLLFIPAHSFEYWNGWLFMGLLFIPMFVAGIILMIKNPELLRKRLNAKEKENEQKWVLLFSGLMFLSGFIIAGLNYRYRWIEMPNIVTMPLVLGSIISFIIFLIYPIIIGKRIKNEEKVLEKDLKGYTEYTKKVKYKVIPFVW